MWDSNTEAKRGTKGVLLAVVQPIPLCTSQSKGPYCRAMGRLALRVRLPVPSRLTDPEGSGV